MFQRKRILLIIFLLLSVNLLYAQEGIEPEPEATPEERHSEEKNENSQNREENSPESETERIKSPKVSQDEEAAINIKKSGKSEKELMSHFIYTGYSAITSAGTWANPNSPFRLNEANIGPYSNAINLGYGFRFGDRFVFMQDFTLSFAFYNRPEGISPVFLAELGPAFAVRFLQIKDDNKWELMPFWGGSVELYTLIPDLNVCTGLCSQYRFHEKLGLGFKLNVSYSLLGRGLSVHSSAGICF